jgi:hypothetical protein
MLELISIHIAKTGGRSFYEILRNEYGDELDQRNSRVDFFPDKDYSNALINRIPEYIRVIHGHLHYIHVKDIHEKYKPKIVTWLREPVDRVISNYYFMIQRVNEDGEKHPQYSKRGHSLIEYAHDSVPNKMSKCLRGINAEDLFFIGFQETFDEDVKRLAGKLGWKKEIPDVHLNAGSGFDSYEHAPTKREDITQEMRNEIATLNKKDIALYREVKRLNF